MAGELYPIISDDEFRGDRYLEAVVIADSVHSTVPAVAHATSRVGDELIVETRDSSSYWVVAVKRDGTWRTPIPTYMNVPSRYMTSADNLRIVSQR